MSRWLLYRIPSWPHPPRLGRLVSEEEGTALAATVGDSRRRWRPTVIAFGKGEVVVPVCHYNLDKGWMLEAPRQFSWEPASFDRKCWCLTYDGLDADAVLAAAEQAPRNVLWVAGWDGGMPAVQPRRGYPRGTLFAVSPAGNGKARVGIPLLPTSPQDELADIWPFRGRYWVVASGAVECTGTRGKWLLVHLAPSARSKWILDASIARPIARYVRSAMPEQIVRRPSPGIKLAYRIATGWWLLEAAPHRRWDSNENGETMARKLERRLENGNVERS